jgi:hypothetical protein
VHSFAAEYNLVTCLLLFLPFFVMLAVGWSVLTDPTVSAVGKQAAKMLIAVYMAIIIVADLLGLPKKFQVLSDASINVVTFVAIKWNFEDATAAYEGKSDLCSFHDRPNVKFTTSLSNVIVVRRKNGGLDLLLSPVDPEAFVNAVFQVAAENEER